MSFPTRVLPRRRAWCALACVLLCAAGWPAAGQAGVAERIAEQRDRAGEGVAAGTPSESAESRPADASPVAGDTDAASELAPIQTPIDPKEQLPLGPAAADGTVQQGPVDSALGSNWIMNTLAAMGVVIGLILLLRWLAKRSGFGAGVRVSASSPIVEVLSRTTVAPRSHIVLLRVGSRILVVNDGPAGMRTLAAVDHPDEVAGLLQSVETAKESSMSNSFGKVMSRLSGGWTGPDDAAELGGDASEAGFDRARTSLSGLRSRLRLAAGTGQGGEA